MEQPAFPPNSGAQLFPLTVVSSIPSSSSQLIAVAVPEMKLMIFPPEIREMIWKELVIQEDSISPLAWHINQLLQDPSLFMNKPSERNVLAIARSCKQAHEEVMAIYFKHNSFQFYDTDDLHSYLSHMRPSYLLYLRTISFLYRGPSQKKAFNYLLQCLNLGKLEIVICNSTKHYNIQRKVRDVQGAHGLSILRGLRVLDPSRILLKVRATKHYSDIHRFGVHNNDQTLSAYWAIPDSEADWLRDTLFGEITGAVKGPVEKKADEKAERERIREAKRKLALDNKAEKAKVREIKRQLAADNKSAKGKKGLRVVKGAAAGKEEKVTPK